MIKKIDKWKSLIIITMINLTIVLAGCGVASSPSKTGSSVIGEYVGTVYEDGTNNQYDDIQVYKDTKNNKLVYKYRDCIEVTTP